MLYVFTLCIEQYAIRKEMRAAEEASPMLIASSYNMMFWSDSYLAPDLAELLPESQRR